MADNTWEFLEHQESNPEALKQAVDTLIGYTKKKGFAGAENAQLDSLELVKHVIICEAAALVLSDDWQAFMKYRKQRPRNRSRKHCWTYKEEQYDKKDSNAQRNRGFCG